MTLTTTPHPLNLSLSCDWLKYASCCWLARTVMCGSVNTTVIFIVYRVKGVHKHWNCFQCTHRMDRSGICAEPDKSWPGAESMTTPLPVKLRHPQQHVCYQNWCVPATNCAQNSLKSVTVNEKNLKCMEWETWEKEIKLCPHETERKVEKERRQNYREETKVMKKRGRGRGVGSSLLIHVNR